MRAPQFEVVAEEIISRYQEMRNGASPMWCYGSPTLVRDGSRVFASLPEVGRNVPPLCNTRWRLFRRGDGARWDLVASGSGYNEREPCPLLRLPEGRIALSVNPAFKLRQRGDDGTERFFCEPRLLVFRADAPDQEPTVLKPHWNAEYTFTEHSYRGVAADHETGEILLLNIVGDEGQAWSLMDREGNAVRNGLLRFPVRGCYPQVALRGRAACVLAVSDIVEPVPEWRDFKRKVTGREWDYDLRQLFFTWTPDIAEQDFSPILTVASRDETAGHLRNLDLWLDDEGDAHVLYLDRNIWHTHVRDKFFPGMAITAALKYCRIHDGRVVARRTLAAGEEDTRAQAAAARKAPDATGFVPFAAREALPTYAAFQVASGGRLFVIYHLDGADAGQDGATGNYALQLLPEAARSPTRLNLTYPLHSFFAASTRTGSEPGDVMDLYGLGPEPLTVNYAQVRMRERQEEGA